MPSILFIGATHGNETLGVKALQQLEKERDKFDWVIGNKKAFSLGVRYTKTDLNRSAPGDPLSNIYEKKRASELISLSRGYQYTIDLHGTDNKTGIFVIITNLTKENLQLASYLNIPRIVIWPSITPEQVGPLSEFFPCGLEIECGPKNDKRIQKQLQTILTDFLDNIDEREKIGWKDRLNKKRIFEMVGSLKRSDVPKEFTLQEFKRSTIDSDSFFPVFINSYDYKDILCYKLQERSLDQVLPRT